MLSRCTIRRKTTTTTWSTTYTNLPLRLVVEGGGSAPSRKVQTAGVEFQVAARVAHLPATTSDIRDGDLIEITAGENAGLVLRVVEATWQDQATARRVPVMATQRPEEW